MHDRKSVTYWLIIPVRRHGVFRITRRARLEPAWRVIQQTDLGGVMNAIYDQLLAEWAARRDATKHIPVALATLARVRDALKRWP
jgi:hypothetical protein